MQSDSRRLGRVFYWFGGELLDSTGSTLYVEAATSRDIVPAIEAMLGSVEILYKAK